MIIKKKVKEDIDKPVFEHLAELRIRLIFVFLSLVVLTVIIYTQTPLLINILKEPIHNFNIDFVFFTITGAFTTRLKLAFITSIILLSPFIYYQLMAFVGLGLTSGERKLVYKAIIYIVPIFIAGVAFGYAFIVPKTLNFLIIFGSKYMSPMLSGEKYLIFIALLCVLVGIITTIPIFFILLARLGILSSLWLKKVRKFIIFTVLIGEGMIASDFMSFLLIGLPFIIVYEISIWIVILIEKRLKNADTVKKARESDLSQH